MTKFAEYSLPIVIVIAGMIIMMSKKDLFSVFLSGCKDGMKMTFDLFPTLLILTVAVRMFSASGAVDALCTIFSPICKHLGIPEGLLPVALMRTVSGSGANAMIIDLFDTEGPDSAAGLAASVMMGSSDTILYTLSVYFSHIKAKRTGYALPVSFVVMIFCLLFSCFLAKKLL